MMRAWKNKEGGYDLSDSPNGPGETFRNKDKIKANGGKWNAKDRCWKVSKEYADSISVSRVYVVRVSAFCHTPEGVNFADPVQIAMGKLGTTFCSRCDSYSEGPKILKVYGEGSEGMEARDKEVIEDPAAWEEFLAACKAGRRD